MSKLISQRVEPPLDGWVATWLERGLITGDQAEQMAADLRAGSTPTPLPTARASAHPSARSDVTTEAFAYLGSGLVIVAVMMLSAKFWDGIGTGGHVAVLSLGSIALLVAGRLVPADDASGVGHRLRSVLWAGCVVAFVFAAGIALVDAAGMPDRWALPTATGCAALLGAVLWRLHPAVLQHLVTLGAIVICAASTVDNLSTVRYWPTPVTIWLVGAAWVGLAARGRLRPRLPAMVFGSITASIGAAMLISQPQTVGPNGAQAFHWGNLVALLTVLALIALAVAEQSTALVAVAAVATLPIVPATMTDWFHGLVAPALGLLVAGLVLVAVAVRVARNRR